MSEWKGGKEHASIEEGENKRDRKIMTTKLNGARVACACDVLVLLN